MTFTTDNGSLSASVANTDATGTATAVLTTSRTAKVTVTAGGARKIKQLLGGTSYCSASDDRLLFGLGASQRAVEVEIRWPSGQIDRISKVAANRLIYVKEGQGIVKTMEFGAKRKS